MLAEFEWTPSHRHARTFVVEPLERRACLAADGLPKLRHLTWSEADDSIPLAEYGRVNAYRCHLCSLWHIGRTITTGAAARTRRRQAKLARLASAGYNQHNDKDQA